MTGSRELAEKFLLLFEDIGRTLAVYPRDIFTKDLEALENDLSPAGRGILSRGLAKFTDHKYKNTFQTLKDLRLNKNASHEQIYAEVKAARDQLLRWNALVPKSVPDLFPGFDEFENWQKQFENDLSILKKYIQNINSEKLELVQLGNIINSLSYDTDTPYRIRRMIEVETEIEQRGAAEILNEIRSSDMDPELWSHLFEYAWFTSCLDKARSDDSSLAGFSGKVHEKIVKEFCELDKKRLELNVSRIKRLHAERVIGAMNDNRDQENLVRRESEKKARHLQLRKLLSLAPDVLTALFPCWMASPLSVSQLVNADHQYFDVVIFDEASQVLPEDAVGSILRASQVVVAGDSHQLPPTTFFVSADDESNDWNSWRKPQGSKAFSISFHILLGQLCSNGIIGAAMNRLLRFPIIISTEIVWLHSLVRVDRHPYHMFLFQKIVIKMDKKKVPLKRSNV